MLLNPFLAIETEDELVATESEDAIGAFEEQPKDGLTRRRLPLEASLARPRDAPFSAEEPIVSSCRVNDEDPVVGAGALEDPLPRRWRGRGGAGGVLWGGVGVPRGGRRGEGSQTSTATRDARASASSAWAPSSAERFCLKFVTNWRRSERRTRSSDLPPESLRGRRCGG